MKRIILVAVMLLMASVAFAAYPSMTFDKAKFTSPTVFIHKKTGVAEMELHDDVATTVTLNQLKTASGATSIPLAHDWILQGDASGIAEGVTKSGWVTTSELATNAVQTEDILNATILDEDLALDYRQITTSTLVVDLNGEGDFTTIQAAIDSIDDSASTNPYTIVICPGVYTITSQINLDEDYISIVGLDKPTFTWDSEGDSPATIYVTGSNCSLRNLIFQNTRAPIDASKALYVYSTQNFEAIHCSFIGSGRDTVQVSYGNATAKFIDCYIEGYSDINFITESTEYYSCRFYVNTAGQEAFYFGSQDNGFEFTVYIVNCFFDGAGTNHIGNFNSDSCTLHFYGNSLSQNITAYSSTGHFEFREHSATIYYTRLGGGLSVGTATGAATGNIKLSGIVDSDGTSTGASGSQYAGDVTIAKGLNVGTATGAGTGQAKLSDGTGTLTIKDNELSTDQDFTVDMIDAANHRTFYIKNSDGTKKANLNVEQYIYYLGGELTYGNMTMPGTTLAIRNNSANDFNLKVDNAGAGKADLEVDRAFKTDGNEYLMHDIIRHTVTADEATSGTFTFEWNTATAAKVVSLSTALYQIATSALSSELNGDSKSWFVGTTITVNEGTVAWAENDIVTIYIVYEK